MGEGYRNAKAKGIASTDGREMGWHFHPEVEQVFSRQGLKDKFSELDDNLLDRIRNTFSYVVRCVRE